MLIVVILKNGINYTSNISIHYIQYDVSINMGAL